MAKYKPILERAVECVKNSYEGTEFKLLKTSFIKKRNCVYEFCSVVKNGEEIWVFLENVYSEYGELSIATDLELPLEQVKAIQAINIENVELFYK